jgi:hypothetical protein
MQYTVFSDTFGGLNDYMARDKVGPGGATVSISTDISDGSLRNRFDDTKATLDVNGVWVTTDTYVPNNSQTIVPWGVGALGMTGRYAVARFGGRLYRSHKGFGAFPSDLDGIQYTSNSATPPTWDYFGLMTPGSPALSATRLSGGNVPVGLQTYFCTFYNALGQESPPTTTTINITTAGTIQVDLPRGYALCTTATGSPTLSSISATDITRFRLGMRLSGSANIPPNSYVIAIGSTTVTISQNAGGSSSSVIVYDAQILGTRLYRSNSNISVPRLVAQTSGFPTFNVTDNLADVSLGEQITVRETTDIPPGMRDVCISPNGTIVCVQNDGKLAYMSADASTKNRPIYNQGKVVPVPDSPLASIYALNKFIFPTVRGAFSVYIDNIFTSVPLIERIDDSEPCQALPHVYPVDVGGEVWWNTNKGIVSTNGQTIETVTKYTFSRSLAENCSICYGADFYNGEYLAYFAGISGILMSWSRQSGWKYLNNVNMSTSHPGTIGFHINQGCNIYTGFVESPFAVRLLYKSTSRLAGGTYQTGDWTGEKASSLKKFRKISALITGNVSIVPYVDNQSVGFSLTSTGSSIIPRRVSFWLPSVPESKGRSINLRITLDSADAQVEELGVWVGEQREPMP